MVNAILLRPLPFPEPDRLAMIWNRATDTQSLTVVSMLDYLEWKARSHSFATIGALRNNPLNISGLAGDAEQVPGLEVTAEFFTALGISPILGRTIQTGEDVQGARRVVVLSYGFWQRRLGGAPDVVGKHLLIGGRSVEIVGVMPARFAFRGLQADLFVPLAVGGPAAPLDGGHGYRIVARLKPQVAIEAARSEMDSIAAQLARERPATNARWGVSVVSLKEQTVGDIRPAVLMLFGAVIGILLIACANVANLFGMRAQARGREMSVRLALGAGRWQLTQQLLAESLLIALIGGSLGLLLAWMGVPLIIALLPPSFPLPHASDITLDRWVLAWTLGVSVGAGLLFGLWPALQASRGNLSESLHAGPRSTYTGARVRAMLVVTEVTLTVIIVIAAGLMVRSLVLLTSVNPGFRPEHVLVMRMLLMPSKYADPGRRVAVIDTIVDRVRALPQVTSASSIHLLPLSGALSGTPYYRLDRPVPPEGTAPAVTVSVVSPGYFMTMGIPMIEGRDFTRSDGLPTPGVAVINQALAAQVFPGEDPIGKRLFVSWGGAFYGRTGPPEFEIVGIVGSTHDEGLHVTPKPCVYLSHDQEPNLWASLVVRTTGDPLAIASSVRQAIRAVDPDQGVSHIESMETMVADSIAQPRIQTLLIGSFGLLALILACVGLYGVLAYSVQHRRREMGVRMAIGATARANLRLVIGEGLRLTLIGIGLGVIGAAWVTRYLRTLLYEVRPADPIVYALVPVAVVIIAILACAIPARRAMLVDPAIVLRDE